MNNLLIPRQVSSHGDIEESKTIPMSVAKVEGKYPHLYLPVAENYEISHKFYGYADIESADNYPMILVELTGLAYRYGTTIYAVDRVNGTMYGKFSVGFRVINERATTELQYKDTTLSGMYESAQSVHITLCQEQPKWLHLWPNPP